ESVWHNNIRRHNERINTLDILHKYSADYKSFSLATPPCPPTKSCSRVAASNTGTMNPAPSGCNGFWIHTPKPSGSIPFRKTNGTGPNPPPWYNANSKDICTP